MIDIIAAVMTNWIPALAGGALAFFVTRSPLWTLVGVGIGLAAGIAEAEYRSTEQDRER